MIQGFTLLAQEPTDCDNSIIICGNSNINLDVSGIGTQELLDSNACSSMENNSLWLKINIAISGTLGFILTPESNSIIEDFDFFVFGPNVDCSDIGQAIRCSTTNPVSSSQANNLTGMNGTEVDINEGPGENGNSFVRWLDVIAGESYFIVIDRPIGNSRFNLEWTGTAQFDNAPVFPYVISEDALKIERCDIVAPFDDGSTTFDLSVNSNLFIGSQSNVEVTYHASESNAILNISKLPFLYTNVSNPETIYARLTNTISECSVISEFQIEALGALNFAVPTDLIICDNNDDGDPLNGQVRFDLSTKNIEILDGLNPLDVNISYHKSQEHAEAGSNPIESPYYNTTPFSELIFIRLENKLNKECFETSSFYLTVNPKPILTVAYLEQCDIDSDGITDFNLTEANQLLSANYENETFTYYLSAPKAKTGYIEDQIPTPVAYTNPTPVNSIVYARVENVHGCFEVSEVNLKVATTLLDPAFHLDYFICDDLLVDNDNSNGIATFDFSDATEKVLLQFPPDPNLRVSYYTTETNALAETNPISDPSNHRNNENPIVQSIYVRIESSETNACLGIGKQITLTVDSLPIKNTIADYELCGDTDQLAFDLTTKEAEILAGQTTPILVSYHESEQHAIDNVPISADLENFINKSNPQKIHVRIQFDPNNNTVLDPRECVRTDMSFNLIVKRNPIVATPDPLIICSDQVVSSVYDLTLKRDQITIGDSTITLDYFESQVDLDANNPIQNPIAYLSSVQSKTIIVLAKGLNGCTTRVDLELKTVLYANLNTAPSVIEECETDTNGFDYFNLRIREEVILNGLNSVDFQISYYEDEMDAILGNTNTIKHPENFENTIIYTQNIYVHVKPLLNDCAVVIKLTVLVNPAPEIDILDRYVICLNRESEIINSINTPFLPQTPINTQLNTTDYSFQWYMGKREEVEANPNSFIIVDATNNTLFPTAEGAYTVIATNLVSGCRISAGTEVVGSYPPESMNIKLLSELFATNNRLEVNVIGNGDYLYRVNYGPWQSENTFNALSLGTHIIDVIDFLNCDQITKTKTIIGYPKFFTPNGDGYNDSWNIVGVNDQDIGKLTIFNRYGKLIKQIRPSGAGWDGTYNGAQLPSSDYWFTLEYTDPTTGNPEMLRAHFSLKR